MANHSKSPNSRAQETEVRGFSYFAARAAFLMGSSTSFVTATAIIVLWAVTGPYFHFSDSWQLVINTATTVITFLMVFLIQNTQNRDARALHLKLDEVIRALHTAHNEMIHIENLSDSELQHLAEHYEQIRKTSEARKVSRMERQSEEKQAREEQGEAIREEGGEQLRRDERKAG